MKKAIFYGWFLTLCLIAAARGDYERWYVVNLQGQPAGYAVERESRSDNQITSMMRMRIAVGRGGSDLTVLMGTQFVETTDGKPISATTTQMLAATTSQKIVKFTDKGMEVTTIDSGRKSTQVLPNPKEQWLTPAGAARFSSGQLANGVKTFTYRSLDPSASMNVIEVTVNVLGKEDVEVMGKVVPATKVEVTTSMMPGVKSVAYVDDQGHTLRNSVSMGFMSLEMVAADKALALTKRQGPELLAETLIHPKQAVANPRKLTKATWVVRMKKGKLPDLVNTAAQTVKRIDDRTAELTVDLTSAKPQAADKVPAVENSSMVDGKDPKIAALMKQAIAGLPADASARAKAQAMRQFVHDYITAKSLDVGMASAGEVARTRTGDCTEHAMLLAAMLRAAGIPSRTVTGLMYVPSSSVMDAATVGPTGVFGYHMWAQAWLDGRWTDLDAILPGGQDSAPFDATHIAISTSDMADGQWVNDLVTLGPIIGELEITQSQPPAPQTK